jgi:uncharacterized membrane protein YedE/YeeE
MDTGVWVVMLGLLVIGLAAGFLMHRSDFCLAGAFRDLFLFKSYDLIRPLVLLLTLSALLFEVCHLTGFLPAYPLPWFAPPAGVNVLGGMVFGAGMVLAGGCVVGVLYKMGGGSLMALVAFLGLLAGSALYAEIHVWWSALAKQTVFSTKAVTLPQWIGGWSFITPFVFVAVGGFFCWRWLQTGCWNKPSAVEGFVPLWFTAIALAVLGFLAVMLCGLPLGVTTSYAIGAALVESWLFPGHLATVSFFSTESVHYALPIDGILRSGGAGPRFDIVAIVQVPLILGIVCGAWLSAYLLGEFRVVWKVPPSQIVMVFFGGIIMALGARMTPGCNVWHLCGGLPLLTMQSILFVIGLLPGAWFGGKILQRVVAQSA